MPRESKAFQRGFEEGRQATLRFLAVAIDCFPKEPSEITTELLSPGEIDMTAVVTELQRFAEVLDSGRRRRRSNAAEVGDAVEPTPEVVS